MNRLLLYISQHKRYLINVCATFFSQFSNAITLIILTPLLTKHLGLKEFGVYGVIINIIAFSIILDFGLNIGLVRIFIHKSVKIDYLLNSMFVFFTSLLLVLFPFYLFFYYYYFHQPTSFSLILIAIYTSIIVVQNIYAVYFDALIQAQNKIYISKIFRAIKLIAELLLILIFLKNINLKIILLIIASVNIFYLSSLFIFLKNEINFKINFKYFNLNELTTHFKYSIWYFTSSLATVLVFNTQIVILNYFSGPEMAAKYLVIVRFFDIIRIAATNFTQVLFPKIILAEVENQWEGLKKMYCSILKKISFLILILFLFFLTFGVKIFFYWIGFNDTQMIPLFYLYLIFTCLIIFDNVSVVFLSALKLNKAPTILSIAQGLIGIILSIILLKYFGYIGLLMGFLISFLVTNLIFNPLYFIRSINKKLF
jgi:O-antigen/teichoic acid export membrane protein